MFERSTEAGRPPETDRAVVSTASMAAPNITVIEDDGTLRPAFDLAGLGMRFEPYFTDGYTLHYPSAGWDGDVGTPLTLARGGSSLVVLPKPFPYFGEDRSVLFVNANGSITFDAGDDQTGDGSFAAGPPRIAALWDDLDPGAGGAVFSSVRPDRIVVTWADVPQVVYEAADEPSRIGANSVQVTLALETIGEIPRGAITLQYGSITLQTGTVGLSPGAASHTFTPDFSEAIGSQRTRYFPRRPAIVERFQEYVDDEAVARAFFEHQPDDVDFLVIFPATAYPTRGSVLAAHQFARNDVSGIGGSIFDRSADYGSRGHLQSVVQMLRLGPAWSVPRLVRLLAHEVGHRWTAAVDVRDGERCVEALRQEDGAHWTWQFDTDGSHLGGRNWIDRGGGRFDLEGILERYSTLDLYLMGILPPDRVRPSTLIQYPYAIEGRPCTAGSLITDCSVTGVGRTVTLDDVVACEGPRMPASDSAQREFRMAFVLLVPAGTMPNPADVAQLDEIRRAWSPFWHAATEGLSSMRSDLYAPDLETARCGDGTIDPGEVCDDAGHERCCVACTLATDRVRCPLRDLVNHDPCLPGDLPRKLAKKIRRLSGRAMRSLDRAAASSSKKRHEQSLHRASRALEEVRARAERAGSRGRRLILSACVTHIEESVDRAFERATGLPITPRRRTVP